MRKLAAIFLLFLSVNLYAQRKDKNNDQVNSTGDYIGTFSDIYGAKGELQISLMETENGISGVVLFQFSADSLLTGSIEMARSRWSAENSTIHFLPSEMRQNRVYDKNPVKDQLQRHSYDCRWHIVLTERDPKSKTLKGKAVPQQCLFSNIISFEARKKE